MSRDYEYKLYIESALVGSSRGLLGLPLEHPFDVVKTRMQSINEKTSIIQVSKDIYRQFGILKGFYAGIIPNSLRVFVKSFYRWPMMVAFPYYLKEHILPKQVMKKYEAAHKVGAGLMIATIESFIVCPFERLKVFLMTKNNKNISIKYFFVNSKAKFGDLFSGLNAQLTKQIISWISFLYIDFKVKQYVKKNFSENGERLTVSQLISCSIFTGILNTLCTHPIDKTKTLYQMQQNDQYKKVTLLQVMKNTYRNHGVSSFYNGWQPRMIQYVIQSLFTCTLLEMLEAKLIKKEVNV